MKVRKKFHEVLYNTSKVESDHVIIHHEGKFYKMPFEQTPQLYQDLRKQFLDIWHTEIEFDLSKMEEVAG